MPEKTSIITPATRHLAKKRLSQHVLMHILLILEILSTYPGNAILTPTFYRKFSAKIDFDYDLPFRGQIVLFVPKISYFCVLIFKALVHVFSTSMVCWNLCAEKYYSSSFFY